ncbi:thioesterase-like superfamily-domain-containing protein [Aspergillus ambiguus]|uniref:thioesterase family protein n=1 Tax=Aspergillus ambiguus TaxID=176160 RepID=UPI003CCDE0B7
MPPQNQSRLSAAVSAITPLDGAHSRFRVNVAREWTTQHSVLGGFLDAVMLAAAQQFAAAKFPDGRFPDPVHVFVQFLKMVPPGEVCITCDLLRASSRQCVVKVDLTAGPSTSPTTVGIVTLADMSKEAGLSQPSQPTACTPPAPPNRETECMTVDDPVVDATPVTAKLNWVAPRPADGFWGHRLGGHHREVWVSFRDGARIDDVYHLALLSDMPLQPPATHQAGFYLRYALSTLCLSVEFKKRPDPSTQWVMIRSNSLQVRDGRYDVNVQILDEAGDILALSNHVVYISELRPRPKAKI